MDLQNFLNELQLTNIGRGKMGGEFRKSVHQVRGSMKSRVPAGSLSNKPWKFSGKWYSDTEADKYLGKKLASAGVEDKEIEQMDIDEKIAKLKEKKIEF